MFQRISKIRLIICPLRTSSQAYFRIDSLELFEDKKVNVTQEVSNN